MSDPQVIFTDSARRALVRAQREAENLGHRYIGTEHLVLGLMDEEMGMACTVLRNLGLELPDLRNVVAEHRPPSDSAASSRELALSPGGRSVVRKAIHVARREGESLIGTEHLLLGLMDQRAGTATRMIEAFGVNRDQVKTELRRLMKSGPQTAPPLDETPGLVFKERYQIESVIGSGSLSTVYRARDLDYHDIVHRVAIKEMSPPADDPQIRETIIASFTREAQLLASLKHPFIPRFYDFFTYERRFYLVMEYIPGRNLGAILEEMPGFLPAERVLKWGQQLCDVLAYLHHHEPDAIIFRDLKPSNVMIDIHDNVRLIDFNIAKVFEVGRASARIGTDGYSAPEQYHGEASPRGDIYALGATLHHLLTRSDPTKEPPFSFEERPIHALNPAIPQEVDQVIAKALAYELDNRYASVIEMRQALDEVLFQLVSK